MRVLIPALFLFLLSCLGCASSGDEIGSAEAGASREGLVEVSVDGPGMLLVREAHAIGGYDALLMPPAALAYRRGSQRLSEEIEESLKAQLEQSVIDTARAAGIELVQTPGDCAMLIGIGLVGVDIGQGRAKGSRGGMTLVMELRDSSTGETLLHYESARSIREDGRDADATDLLVETFDELVRRADLGGTLRAAVRSHDGDRPGCEGRIAEHGRDGAAASTR